MKTVQKWIVNKTWWHLKTNQDFVIVSSKEITMVKTAYTEGVAWSTVTKSEENKTSPKRLLIPQCGEKECSARRMSGNGESLGREWDIRTGKLNSTLAPRLWRASSFLECLPRSGVIRAGGV